MTVYTFENKRGDVQHITGTIEWGGNFEWMTEKKDDSIQNLGGIMPMNVWCKVKSYHHEMFGVWKLTNYLRN